MATGFTFRDFEAPTVNIDQGFFNRDKVARESLSAYFAPEIKSGHKGEYYALSSAATGKGNAWWNQVDNPGGHITLGMDRLIQELRDIGADDTSIGQLEGYKQQFLSNFNVSTPEYSETVYYGGDAGQEETVTRSHKAIEAVAGRSVMGIGGWAGINVESAARRPGFEAYGKAVEDTWGALEGFLRTEQQARATTSARKVYDAERSFAQAQYEQELAAADMARMQEEQRKQQVLFDNQRDLGRINQDNALTDSGTGLAQRLLGGTAQEEGGRASTADSPSSAVGFNTSTGDENRKRRGLSSAVGINL